MVKASAWLLTGCTLLVSGVLADGGITSAWVHEIIEVTDTASVNQDAGGIEPYLATDFYRYIDVPTNDIPATVRIDKTQYLEMIDKGWQSIDQYDYQRTNTVVHVAKDGRSAESFSTVVENVVTSDGQEMVSKVREYASYTLEDGRPVIISIESLTLVGDTTPE